MFELKINVRHTETGAKIRSVTKFNNFKFTKRFNSFASTFSFDFYFDSKDQNTAETVCVSHMHECQIFYNGKLKDTGFILRQAFKDTGKPELATISGYSKPGALDDCDIPFSQYPLETDGLSFKSIISKLLQPFKLNLKVSPAARRVNEPYVTPELSDNLDEEMDKTSSESSQNVGSYLSTLAKQKNIVLSHNEKGDVLITSPNTKGTPIFNFDLTKNRDGQLTNTSPTNDANKIPVMNCELDFNGQGMHTEISVIQQADDEEGSNASGPKSKRNPLIPIGKNTLYRPKTFVMSSGNQFTLDQLINYEMGREVRENIKLKIELGTVEVNEDLIAPNNTITVVNPEVFLYTKSTWFIESVEASGTPESQTCILNCVLPFGYDFDFSKLTNVFVDAHKNFPRL